MNTPFTCNSTALVTGVSISASDGSDVACDSETEPQISLRLDTTLKTDSETISTPMAVQAMSNTTAPIIVDSNAVSTSTPVAAEIPASSSLTPANPEWKTFSTPPPPSPPVVSVAATTAAAATLDSSAEFFSTFTLSGSTVVVTETLSRQETATSDSREPLPVQSVSVISSEIPLSSTPASGSSSPSSITSSSPNTVIGSSPTSRAHLTVIVTSTVLSVLLISGAALLVRRRMKRGPSNAKTSESSEQIDPFVLPICTARRSRRSILKAQISSDRPVEHVPTMKTNEPLRTEVIHLPRSHEVITYVAGPSTSYPASPLALRNPGSLPTPGTNADTHAVVDESNDSASSSQQQLSANCDITTIPRVVSGMEILPTMMQGFHDLQTRMTRITNFLRQQHQDANQDMTSQLASSEHDHNQISPPAYDGEIEAR